MFVAALVWVCLYCSVCYCLLAFGVFVLDCVFELLWVLFAYCGLGFAILCFGVIVLLRLCLFCGRELGVICRF